MEYDDKVRTGNGLAVCLRDMGNGKSRLFIDDITSNKNENPIDWSFETFYTFTPEIDNLSIDQMELTDNQFMKIGEMVVARLLAQSGRVK